MQIACLNSLSIRRLGDQPDVQTIGVAGHACGTGFIGHRCGQTHCDLCVCKAKALSSHCPQLVLDLLATNALAVIVMRTGGFGGGLLNSLRQVLWVPINQRAFRRVSLDVFGHLLDMDLDFHLHRKTGAAAHAELRTNLTSRAVFSPYNPIAPCGLPGHRPFQKLRQRSVATGVCVLDPLEQITLGVMRCRPDSAHAGQGSLLGSGGESMGACHFALRQSTGLTRLQWVSVASWDRRHRGTLIPGVI